MTGKKREVIDAKQQKLESEFDAGIVSFSESVKQNLQKNQEKIDELHGNRVQQLLNLIEKQSRIEKEIIKTTTILSDQYDKSMKLFRTVLSDRLSECEDTLDELKTLANEQEWQGTVGEHA